mgnify:CR=1 FL=1
MQHVSRSGEKGGPSAQQMVESRMLYVGTEESMLLYPIFFALYEKAMCNIHPLCSQRSTPTCYFDVKAQTQESRQDSCRPASR